MRTSICFTQIIQNKLVQQGANDVDNFISILIDTKSVIAGSFPLQCLLGEEYENSDIDIFCMGQKESWDERNGRDKREICLTKIDRYLYGTYGMSGTPSTYMIDGIIRNKYYKISDKLVFNVVQVNKNPFDFVKETFDFSFCQTIFDGKVLHFHPLTLAKMGYRLHSSLCRYKKREPYHMSRTTGKKNVDEFLKYPDNPAIYMCEQNEKRRKKYEDRGFMIVNFHKIDMLKQLFAMTTDKLNDESNVALDHKQDDELDDELEEEND